VSRILVSYPELCIGCKKCEKECAIARDGVSRVAIWTWKDETGRHSVPMQCRQCDDAACIAVCPTGALRRAPGESGLVEFDEGDCVLCQACVEACVFGGIRYVGDSGGIVKCDTCAGEPKCVAICPKGALEYVDADEAALCAKAAAADTLKEAYGRFLIL